MKETSEKAAPDFMTEWSGSRKELLETVEEVIDDIQVSMNIRISAKDMRKLFLDAFSRNAVQSNLRAMIADILKDTDIHFEE